MCTCWERGLSADCCWALLLADALPGWEEGSGQRGWDLCLEADLATHGF